MAVLSAMPALYLGHGAPPLVDDALGSPSWRGPRPAAAERDPDGLRPLGGGAADDRLHRDRTPLTYDFCGFPQHYYESATTRPERPTLAATVEALMPDDETVAARRSAASTTAPTYR